MSGYATLRCDICGEENSEPSLAYARRRAKEDGWKRRTFNGNLLDICSDCFDSDYRLTLRTRQERLGKTDD